MNYYQYLKSDLWKQKKAQFWASGYFKKGKYCMACKAKNLPLEVHHRSYKRLFKEHLTDLMALCRKCHQTVHNYHKNSKSQKNNLWWASTQAAKKIRKISYIKI